MHNTLALQHASVKKAHVGILSFLLWHLKYVTKLCFRTVHIRLSLRCCNKVTSSVKKTKNKKVSFLWKEYIAQERAWALESCSGLIPSLPLISWVTLGKPFSVISYLTGGQYLTLRQAGRARNCQHRDWLSLRKHSTNAGPSHPYPPGPKEFITKNQLEPRASQNKRYFVRGISLHRFVPSISSVWDVCWGRWVLVYNALTLPLHWANR